MEWKITPRQDKICEFFRAWPSAHFSLKNGKAHSLGSPILSTVVVSQLNPLYSGDRLSILQIINLEGWLSPVEGTRLEIERGATHRGFESHPFRHFEDMIPRQPILGPGRSRFGDSNAVRLVGRVTRMG
jgi:hypothetical protein